MKKTKIVILCSMFAFLFTGCGLFSDGGGVSGRVGSILGPSPGVGTIPDTSAPSPSGPDSSGPSSSGPSPRDIKIASFRRMSTNAQEFAAYIYPRIGGLLASNKKQMKIVRNFPMMVQVYKETNKCLEAMKVDITAADTEVCQKAASASTPNSKGMDVEAFIQTHL